MIKMSEDPIRTIIATIAHDPSDNPDCSALKYALETYVVCPDHYRYAVQSGKIPVLTMLFAHRSPATVAADRLYNNGYAEFLRAEAASEKHKVNKRSAQRSTPVLYKVNRSMYSVPDDTYVAALRRLDLNMIRTLMSLGVPCDATTRQAIACDEKLSGYESMFRQFMYKYYCMPHKRSLKTQRVADSAAC